MYQGHQVDPLTLIPSKKKETEKRREGIQYQIHKLVPMGLQATLTIPFYVERKRKVMMHQYELPIDAEPTRSVNSRGCCCCSKQPAGCTTRPRTVTGVQANATAVPLGTSSEIRLRRTRCMIRVPRCHLSIIGALYT